jgi:3'-5' exoribonuclease
MARLLDLPTLTPGARVQDPLLVLDAEQKSFDGGSYTILHLGNSTGRIDSAPVWDREAAMVEGIRKGHVVQVIGEVGEFRGKRQLRLTSVRPLPAESVDLARLLPSVGDVAPYWESVDGWRAEIAKPRLARVLALFYEEEEFRRDYGRCPASIAGHHAALGGLLKHTVEVGAIARTIARVAGADPDVVLAGVLLHDIGKLESYRWDGIFEYTDAGYLLGHVVLGARMLDRRIDLCAEPPCTEQERHILLHLILSHHGKLEFGSPVTPMTLEAEALHWADNASAKTASMADALAEAAAFGDRLVSRNTFWQLDRRRAYRGTSDWGAPVTA